MASLSKNYHTFTINMLRTRARDKCIKFVGMLVNVANVVLQSTCSRYTIVCALCLFILIHDFIRHTKEGKISNLSYTSTDTKNFYYFVLFLFILQEQNIQTTRVDTGDIYVALFSFIPFTNFVLRIEDGKISNLNCTSKGNTRE